MHLGSSPQCHVQLRMPISGSAIRLESHSNVTKNSNMKGFQHTYHNCAKYDQMVESQRSRISALARKTQNEQKRSDLKIESDPKYYKNSVRSIKHILKETAL